MKLSTAIIKEKPRLIGLLDKANVIDLAEAHHRVGDNSVSPSIFDCMQTFIEAGEDAIQAYKTILSKLVDSNSAPYIYPLEKIKLLAPIPNPKKNIMCVGRNYKEHVHESKQLSGTAQPIPEKPIFFSKPLTTIISSNDYITYSTSVTKKVDYEGELAIIIGKGGKDIQPEKAMEHVFGYTLMNDVSARDLQFSHVQYFKGKSLDTFAPLGPWIVHHSEISDYRKLHLQTKVNGELRQSALLEELIFDIPTLISVLSAGMTLDPGDIIATGTPAGVGGGFDPQRFLKNGDVVEIINDEIGTLSNPVRESK